MNATRRPLALRAPVLRATMTWMAIGVLCAAGGAAGGDAVKTTGFNAIDYGAVGDDKTDNTAAFAKCLDAVIAAGGGRMYLPSGVYRGRIVIPPVSKPIPSWITVEIVGENEPTPVFGTIGNFPLQNRGTIVKCLETTGPAVISASSSPASLYGGFSAVHVVIRNLDVRTYNNPGIGGIDLHYALQCRIENVFVNTGVYNVQASKPAHGTKGLVTPAVNNAALTILHNVTVTGYSTVSSSTSTPTGTTSSSRAASTGSTSPPPTTPPASGGSVPTATLSMSP